jgi:hypothetical protein
MEGNRRSGRDRAPIDYNETKLAKLIFDQAARQAESERHPRGRRGARRGRGKSGATCEEDEDDYEDVTELLKSKEECQLRWGEPAEDRYMQDMPVPSSHGRQERLF